MVQEGEGGGWARVHQWLYPSDFTLSIAVKTRLNYPYFVVKATEAQNGVFICSRSHSKEVVGNRM